jgi:hypothetical protein
MAASVSILKYISRASLHQQEENGGDPVKTITHIKLRQSYKYNSMGNIGTPCE